jgi:hypothetical protein
MAAVIVLGFCLGAKSLHEHRKEKKFIKSQRRMNALRLEQMRQEEEELRAEWVREGEIVPSYQESIVNGDGEMAPSYLESERDMERQRSVVSNEGGVGDGGLRRRSSSVYSERSGREEGRAGPPGYEVVNNGAAARV